MKLHPSAVLRRILGPRAAVVALAVLSTVIAGCRASEGEPKAEEEEPSGSVLVQTQRIARGSVEQKLGAIGQVEFDSTRVRTIPFPGSGQVSEVAVVAGEAVHAGQLIARLGALPAAGLESQRARMNADYARRELDRVTRLRAEHLATNGDLETAQKGLAGASAELSSLGAGSGKGGRELKAPADGVVAQIKVAPGDLVQAGETAFTLAPADALVARVGFDPEDAAQLRAGLPVELSALFARGEGTPVATELTHLHSVVDPATQRVEAVVRVPTDAGMFVGERVRVAVSAASIAEALVVPREALTDRDGEEGVFIVADEHAYWHPVRVGVRGEALLEAESGVEEGDDVVVAGHSSLADESKVRLAESDVAAGPKDEKESAEPVPKAGAATAAPEPAAGGKGAE